MGNRSVLLVAGCRVDLDVEGERVTKAGMSEVNLAVSQVKKGSTRCCLG